MKTVLALAFFIAVAAAASVDNVSIVTLEGIQQQRGPNFTPFRPPPPIYLNWIFPILQFEISSLMNWIFFPV